MLAFTMTGFALVVAMLLIAIADESLTVTNTALFPQDDYIELFAVHTSFIPDTPPSPLPQPKHRAQRWSHR